METQNHDVRIFNGTLSSAIGLKLAGSEVLPFLCIRIVYTLSHACGPSSDSQELSIITAITIPEVSKNHLME